MKAPFSGLLVWALFQILLFDLFMALIIPLLMEFTVTEVEYLVVRLYFLLTIDG
jgi:hypothetical protein